MTAVRGPIGEANGRLLIRCQVCGEHWNLDREGGPACTCTPEQASWDLDLTDGQRAKAGRGDGLRPVESDGARPDHRRALTPSGQPRPDPAGAQSISAPSATSDPRPHMAWGARLAPRPAFIYRRFSWI